MALGDHLGADQDIHLAAMNAVERRLRAALAARRIGIDAQDAGRRKKLLQPLLHPLRAASALRQACRLPCLSAVPRAAPRPRPRAAGVRACGTGPIARDARFPMMAWRTRARSGCPAAARATPPNRAPNSAILPAACTRGRVPR